MKYSISNIAWKYEERLEIYALMKKYQFSGLEVAPSLFVNNSKLPYDEKDEVLMIAKNELDEFSLELTSMQSLLFGADNLHLFQGKKYRDDLFNYCKKAIDFARKLSIPNLVFGSPKNRIVPQNMDSQELNLIAIDFFKTLGQYAISKNTCIAMEANSTKYGCNYITTTNEAISLIKEVNSAGFKLNLDMGTMSLEGERAELISNIIPYVNHIHISEGFLAPIYSGDKSIHIDRAKFIKNSGYDKYISIEMTSISENNLEHVRRALEFVREIY